MYPNLRAEMARAEITGTMLANYLGITLSTFSLKFNGKSDFTFIEAVMIKNFLNVDIPLEILFAKAA